MSFLREKVHEIVDKISGDAVINIEAFERLVGKFELYKLLDEGMADLKQNRILPAKEVFWQIEDGFK